MKPLGHAIRVLLASVLLATAALKVISPLDRGLFGHLPSGLLAAMEVVVALGLIARRREIWPLLGVLGIAIVGGILAVFSTRECGCAGSFRISNHAHFCVSMTIGFLTCVCGLLTSRTDTVLAEDLWSGQTSSGKNSDVG